MLFLYYVFMNRKRKVVDDVLEEHYMEREVWERLTDMENRRFRYVY